MIDSISQSIQATTPSRMGEPEEAGVHASPAKRSVLFIANALHTETWSAASTFTQNEPASRRARKLVDFLSGKNVTSGGSRDTDAKDPTVIPAGIPSTPTELTTTTPCLLYTSPSPRDGLLS